MERKTHPEAYDYMVKLEGSSTAVDDMLDSLVIGIWEGHADIRAGKPGLGMMVEQNDVVIENGVEVLGPDYMGYFGESYEEAIARKESEDLYQSLPNPLPKRPSRFDND